MTVTDERRQGLATMVDHVLGTEHGSTLMELLSQPNWDDLATKADLAALEQRLERRLEERIDQRLDRRFAQFEARLTRSVMTWLLTGMGIQTGVIGLLLAID